VHTVAGDPHDRNDLLDGGRIGRISHALVARRTPGVKARHRRRRPTTTGGIKNGRSGHELQNRDTTGSAARVRSPSRRAQ
jgi:hypothetical protein